MPRRILPPLPPPEPDPGTDRIGVPRGVPLTVLLLALIGCDPGPSFDATLDAARWAAEEAALAEAFARSRVRVTGRVLDAEGRPVEGAEVLLDALGTTTGPDGAWVIDVPRRNAVLTVEAPGARRHVGGVWLARPLHHEQVVVDPIRLDPADDAKRVLFTGDTMMGRRFLDPDESTPRDEMPPEDPEATIRASTAEDDSVAVVAGVLPWFEAADHAVVNLESPVTDDPSTPHETKLYAYFTLPGSLAALQSLGVDVVSLGNNHTYDYLDQGVTDTLRHLDDAGLAHAGMGLTPAEATTPLRQDVDGVPYSWVSLTSISGRGRALPLFVATEEHGGAADMQDDDVVREAVEGEVDAGRIPVALLHMGVEYSRRPTDYGRSRAQFVADAGAPLVIGHHPHTPQGFDRLDGGAFAAWSLGNFLMDQDRLETLQSFTLGVDLHEDEVVRARFFPHLLDDYHVVPAVGELADRIVRDAGEVSDQDDLDTLHSAGRGLILEDLDAWPRRERVVEVPIRVGDDGLAHVDLRPWREPGEVVGTVRDPRDVLDRAWLGSDILHYGTFEDQDVDAEDRETPRWDHGETSGACMGPAFRGVQAMCMVRDADNGSEAVVAFRHRIRVLGDAENTPVKDQTLMGWWRAENAGRAHVDMRVMASFGERVFGDDQVVLEHPGGSFTWSPFAVDLPMPDDRETVDDPLAENARAVRLFLHHAPPERGAGRMAFDDLAVVGWHLGPWTFEDGVSPPGTHGADFVRVEGAPGEAVIEVVFRRRVRE